MDKIVIKDMDQVIYKEVLDNGLTVFICKTPSFVKKYAYFQTRYGSCYNEFIPLGKKEYKKFPLGIAHFLEHKLFESSDNESVFEAFINDTAYCNAATSYDRTFYYFSCNDKFNNNLNRLIDMVQSPYFTDSNVEKEKGIIGQEIDMYQNDPNQTVYDKLYYNSFVNDPVRFDIAGSKKDIKKITKEDLYECYNTFYHPSNMFLTVVGDVDEKEVINVIKENQSKKTFPKKEELKVKKIKEPKEVFKKEEVVKRNVINTKIGYSYKILYDNLSLEESLKRSFYIDTFLRTKFGELTEFTEKLINKGLCKSYFNYYFMDNKNNALITFTGDITDDKKVKKLIDDKLSTFDDLEEDFYLFKKSNLSDYIKTFESPSAICNYIRFLYNRYGKIIDNWYNIIKEVTFDEYLEFIKSIDFSNQSKITIVGNKGE
ncbi:MAG: insulinase family protein [Bacilli bacterium]|nr:insulinase family protein [Bacilli bacterium]